MGELGRLIQAHFDDQRYPVSVKRFAESVGVTRQTVGNWMEGMSKLPTAENLRHLASELGLPYRRVLEAALADAGYLPRAGEGRGQQPPSTTLVDVTDPGEVMREPQTPGPRGSGPRGRGGQRGRGSS